MIRKIFKLMKSWGKYFRENCLQKCRKGFLIEGSKKQMKECHNSWTIPNKLNIFFCTFHSIFLISLKSRQKKRKLAVKKEESIKWLKAIFISISFQIFLILFFFFISTQFFFLLFNQVENTHKANWKCMVIACSWIIWNKIQIDLL